MRLADFILANREPIMAEWEAFARTCGPASGTMDVSSLRDHANQMLTVVVADLRTPQDEFVRAEKSKGHAPDDGAEATAAEEHGAGRARSGFTVMQIMAEFRALRASVIQLWRKDREEWQTEDLEDLTRFNEAIDQALAESMVRFDQDVKESKDMFLAILGHDLRTPLGAIYSAATFMLDTGELEEPHRTLATRSVTSAKRAVAMVGELLDFTRSRLGNGIPVVRAEMSLGDVVRDVIDEASAAHPGSRIEGDIRDDLRGDWDAARLTQALSNLVSNAVQHGAEGTPVTVQRRAENDHVAISVHNRGDVIPPDEVDGIFNPMKSRRSSWTADALGPTGHLGLGLYITERIVSAHDGYMEVESSESQGTTFTIILPRTAPTPGS